MTNRRDKSVPRLVPPKPAFDREAARQAAAQIWARGNKVTLGPGLTLKDLIEDGRRS